MKLLVIGDSQMMYRGIWDKHIFWRVFFLFFAVRGNIIYLFIYFSVLTVKGMHMLQMLVMGDTQMILMPFGEKWQSSANHTVRYKQSWKKKSNSFDFNVNACIKDFS